MVRRKWQDSQTVTITVDEVNAAPTLDPIGDKSVEEGSLLTFTATGDDPETATRRSRASSSTAARRREPT